MQGSTKGHLPPKVIFHPWSSSTQGRLPQKVVFHPKSSCSEGPLPPKVTFHSSLERPSDDCFRTHIIQNSILPSSAKPNPKLGIILRLPIISWSTPIQKSRISDLWSSYSAASKANGSKGFTAQQLLFSCPSQLQCCGCVV